MGGSREDATPSSVRDDARPSSVTEERAPWASPGGPAPRVGGTVSGMVPKLELETLLEELRVQQAELEVQNDELRHTQAALERSRDRYFQLFDQAPVAYLLLGEDRLIQEANQAAERLLERPLEVLRGMDFSSLVAVHEADGVRRLLGDTDAARDPRARTGLEVELWRAGGSEAAYVQLESAALVLDDGARRQLLTLVDVTRRVVAEHALEEREFQHRALVVRSQESERRYRTLFEDSRDAIVLVSAPSRRIVEANGAAARLFGSGPAALRGVPVDDLFAWSHLAPGARATLERLFDPDRGAGGAATTLDGELFVKTREARVAPVELGVNHIELDGESLTVATFRDRSALVRAQAERETLELSLRQAQKMEAVGTLAGGVAHDMNNVLGAIVGLASATLADRRLDDSVRGDLERMLQSAERGAELTRNLLGFARKGKFRREPVDVDGLLGRVADLLRRTVSKQVRIVIDAAPDLPAVLGDANQLSHALMNLCLNAIDAMDGVGRLGLSAEVVEISPDDARHHPDLETGRYVCLTVKDSGRGMDESTRLRAFEPFFTTKPPGEGTGLGLSMVYGTARGHGGAVLIDSVPKEGTAVRFHLPLPMAPEAEAGPAPRPTPIGNRRVDALPGEALSVLVVDDEPDVQRSTGRLLQTLGHRVLRASSGAEALDVYGQAGAGEIDVVLLDMIMPGMDGEEVFARLQQIDPGVRVVVCSGYSRNERVEALVRRGAVGFLEKPFARRQLRDVLVDVVAGRG